MAQEEVNSKPQFLELEASETLAEGQNFYDQPPFSPTIQDIATKYGLTLDKIRRILTNLIRNPNDYSTFQQSKGLLIPHTLRRNLNIRKPAWRAYSQALGEIDTTLADYPLWRDYTRINLATVYYKQNGDWTTHKINPRLYNSAPNRSYAKWVTDTLAVRERTKLFGIQDVLPKGFPNNSLATPIPMQESSGTNTRRWQILKASNLVPERGK